MARPREENRQFETTIFILWVFLVGLPRYWQIMHPIFYVCRHILAKLFTKLILVVFFSMRRTYLYSPTNKGQNWNIIVRGLCFIGVWVRDKSNQVFFWVQISKMLKTNNIYFQTCFSAQNSIQRILLRFYMEETYKFSEIFWRSCRRTGSALRQLV